MGITQKSRWDDNGSTIPINQAKYTAGQQPIAEYDNKHNKDVVDDISAIINDMHKLRLREILTYEDAVLSGAPKIIRVSLGGTYYYAKAYPTISAEAGISNDSLDVPVDVYSLNDATLSGTPKTTFIETNGENHFFQAYPTLSASVFNYGTLEPKPNFLPVKSISGTPRIAKFLVNSVPYYMKVYSNKN